jgi:hypothetical protein
MLEIHHPLFCRIVRDTVSQDMASLGIETSGVSVIRRERARETLRVPPMVKGMSNPH